MCIVKLKNGNEFIAENYTQRFNELELEYEFKVISTEGFYYFTCDQSDVASIEEVDEEKDRDRLNKIYTGKEKVSYYLDESYPMYDMCFCIAKCKKPCARKKGMSGICTVSDFTNTCSDYEEEK